MKNRLMLIVLSAFSLSVNAYIPDSMLTFPEQRLAAGKVLIASKALSNGMFRKSVILLTRYGQEGAMGLIINRPSKFLLEEAFLGLNADDKSRRLFVGGPVRSSIFSILIKTKKKGKGLTPVMENIYHMFGTREIIEKTGRNFLFKTDIIRFYSGYAGWRKGQLESEIKRGGWHVMEANPETLFDMDIGSMWETLIREVQGEWI